MERAIIYCVIRPIVITSGILGNILSLIVLSKMEDSSTTSKFLKGLAVADTMTLVIRCIEMVFVWKDLFMPYHIWKLNSYSVFKLSHLSERISKCLTVAIVAERVVAVTKPFSYKSICTPVRTTVIIVVCYILMTSTSLPIIVDAIYFDYNTQVNRTINPMADESQLYLLFQLSKSKIFFIHNFINKFAFDFIPIPIVMICNIIIIVWLRKGKFAKSTASESQQQRKQQERKLTKLLLTISILFLVLCGPIEIYAFLVLSGVVQRSTSAMDSFTSDVLMTLSLINSAINFIVYAVMNKKYREGYMMIFRCFKERDEILSSSGTHRVIVTNTEKE